MSRKYLVNGDPVSFQELIKLAQDYGYKSPDGFYCTSEAARILRAKAGATVEEAPNEKEPSNA